MGTMNAFQIMQSTVQVSKKRKRVDCSAIAKSKRQQLEAARARPDFDPSQWDSSKSFQIEDGTWRYLDAQSRLRLPSAVEYARRSESQKAEYRKRQTDAEREKR